MNIRKTGIEDIEEVMRIYERAVRYMAETGNPNQWPAGYPSRAMVLADIQKGISYVMEEDGCIEAVFMYAEGIDPTYVQITQGAWRNGGAYGTMHRLASAGRKRGIAGACFAWCAQQAAAHGCGSVRADTHRDNLIMQRALARHGFVYCGIIYAEDGTERLAYERVLWQEKNTSYGNGATAGMGGGYTGGGYAGYGRAAVPQKGDGIALGITSMVLGIVSLLLFCSCINFVLAIAAIVFGIVQIVKNREHSFAITGIVTASISLLLSFVLWGMLLMGMTKAGYEVYDTYYYEDDFYPEIPFYQDGDFDSDDGFYEYYENGAEEKHKMLHGCRGAQGGSGICRGV